MSQDASNPNQPGVATVQANPNDAQPELFLDRSFWGLMVTQFLGAFNDNLYKQLMLLLALPAAISAGAGEAAADDVQGWATLVFATPFVLFSGFAGFLSDRFKKTPIIVFMKYAEIGIMALGLLAFLYYDSLGELATWTVLFMMGTHSAFFGPGKYGLLPELFRYRDLPRANGLILMSTFLAIILGMVAAGFLKTSLEPSQLWIGSLVCMGIAVVGTVSAHLIRHTPPANPDVKLTIDSWGVSKEMVQLFKQDRPLLMAIIVSSVFWLISGLAAPVVNRLGVQQLEVDEKWTSILTASIALGIMAGALAASVLCRSRLGKYAVSIGLVGILLSLILLGSWHGQKQLLGYQGSLFVLTILGICAAIFSIPVQVFLQSRPPKELKGRLIATMNQANFVGILLAGPLYQLFVRIADALGWPISSVFWMMGLLVLPLAVFYRLDARVNKTDD